MLKKLINTFPGIDPVFITRKCRYTYVMHKLNFIVSNNIHDIYMTLRVTENSKIRWVRRWIK